MGVGEETMVLRNEFEERRWVLNARRKSQSRRLCGVEDGNRSVSYGRDQSSARKTLGTVTANQSCEGSLTFNLLLS